MIANDQQLVEASSDVEGLVACVDAAPFNNQIHP